jgi:17beta-estradiol 17-dehydrogenase / very-long-chain 3-oxoacyl-CoA reductase
MISTLWTNFLAAVGALAVARLTILAARRLHQLYLRRSTLSRYLSKDPGCPSWALVTGASDGIGKAFANELCARGANIILHGRNESKLRRVKAELIAAHPNRNVEVAVADAAQYDSKAAIDKIVQLAGSLPDGGSLRILVNNVGGANALIGQGIFHRVTDTTLDEIDTLINVNVRFPTRLTTALLPILTASNNAPTLIFNLGSLAGVNRLPYTVVYNATKAFNLSFSASLAAEMATEGQDVEVIGLIVGSVDTAGAPKEDQDAPFCIEPSEMAKSALDSVGCGEPVLAAHWKHWLTVAILKLVPQTMITSKTRANWIKEKKAK